MLSFVGSFCFLLVLFLFFVSLVSFFCLLYCLSHHLHERVHESDSTAVGPGYFSSTRRGFRFFSVLFVCLWVCFCFVLFFGVFTCIFALVVFPCLCSLLWCTFFFSLVHFIFLCFVLHFSLFLRIGVASVLCMLCLVFHIVSDDPINRYSNR